MLFLLPSCETISPTLLKEPRSVELSRKTFTEEYPGQFISWECKDFVTPWNVLVEVGHFNFPEDNLGFVLYDGSNSGELSNYRRKGINHRWDWGPNGYEFAFTIKPGGTGQFYDFSQAEDGEAVKSDNIYKCYGR